MAERTSRTLFVTNRGEALRFYMRPCTERAKLRPIIEKGGGIVESKADGSNVFRLVQPDDHLTQPSSKDIRTAFVYECVSSNRLLPVDEYLIQNQEVDVQNEDVENQGASADVIDIENSDEDVPITEPRVKKSRTEYTLKEDQNIVDYIIQRKEYGDVKGRAMWERMAKKLSNRTWQSLKERYIKRILTHLSLLQVTEEQFKMLRKGAGTWTHEDKRELLRMRKKKQFIDRQVLESALPRTSSTVLEGNTNTAQNTAAIILESRESQTSTMVNATTTRQLIVQQDNTATDSASTLRSNKFSTDDPVKEDTSAPVSKLAKRDAHLMELQSSCENVHVCAATGVDITEELSCPPSSKEYEHSQELGDRSERLQLSASSTCNSEYENNSQHLETLRETKIPEILAQQSSEESISLLDGCVLGGHRLLRNLKQSEELDDDNESLNMKQSGKENDGIGSSEEIFFTPPEDYSKGCLQEDDSAERDTLDDLICRAADAVTIKRN